MFDIGASELLLVVIVAIVVIGPKDLPLALRTAGRWIGKIRRVSGHFRSGIETMIREAELEEMERKWREQNAAIMAAHPEAATPAALPAAEVADDTASAPASAPAEPVSASGERASVGAARAEPPSS
jgi:sec-independent protein translocase protein TatB